MSYDFHGIKRCSDADEAEKSAAADVNAANTKSEKKKPAKKAVTAGATVDAALACLRQASKVRRRIRLVDEQFAGFYGKKRPAAFCPIKVSQQTFDAAAECDRKCMVVVQSDHCDASV
jgi:hypothetical protein